MPQHLIFKYLLDILKTNTDLNETNMELNEINLEFVFTTIERITATAPTAEIISKLHIFYKPSRTTVLNSCLRYTFPNRNHYA